MIPCRRKLLPGLAAAIAAPGPLKLPKSGPKEMNFGSGSGAEKKVWRDLWSAGQGVGQIDRVVPVSDVVSQLAREYLAARQRLSLSS